jgi:RNA polymerase sigma factor (TIGR02999 family)
MTGITQVLASIERGEPHAADELLPLVYDELRKLAAARMAAESPDHTLQATALVHEAYVRLVGADAEQYWNSRGHFFAAAAEAMRRILVENARRKARVRAGGGRRREELRDVPVMGGPDPETLLVVDTALTELAASEPDVARVVKLHFFAGMTLDETADVLQVSRATVYRHWAYARATLRLALKDADPQALD